MKYGDELNIKICVYKLCGTQLYYSFNKSEYFPVAQNESNFEMLDHYEAIN